MNSHESAKVVRGGVESNSSCRHRGVGRFAEKTPKLTLEEMQRQSPMVHETRRFKNRRNRRRGGGGSKKEGYICLIWPRRLRLRVCARGGGRGRNAQGGAVKEYDQKKKGGEGRNQIGEQVSFRIDPKGKSRKVPPENLAKEPLEA